MDMRLLLDLGPLSWHGLSLLSLLREAQTRIEHLKPGQPLSPGDEQFFTQLLAVSRAATAMVQDPARYRNPWSSLIASQPEQKDLLAEPQYFFSGDGTLAFLLVRPVKEKGSFTAALKSVQDHAFVPGGAQAGVSRTGDRPDRHAGAGNRRNGRGAVGHRAGLVAGHRRRHGAVLPGLSRPLLPAADGGHAAGRHRLGDGLD